MTKQEIETIMTKIISKRRQKLLETEQLKELALTPAEEEHIKRVFESIKRQLDEIARKNSYA